jgi:hypothetical protein
MCNEWTIVPEAKPHLDAIVAEVKAELDRSDARAREESVPEQDNERVHAAAQAVVESNWKAAFERQKEAEELDREFRYMEQMDWLSSGEARDHGDPDLIPF